MVQRLERAAGGQALGTSEPRRLRTPWASGWVSFRQGFIAALPLWLSIAPVGVAFAVAAHAAGLGAAETIAMSLLVNAGAAQFTAVALLAGGADVLSIAVATLVVNLRHIPFAISLSPLLADLRWFRRAVLAFSLSDPSYAVSVQQLHARAPGSVAFFLGAGASLYVCWVLCTTAGVLIDDRIPNPESLGLHLVFPLSLMALLVPFLHSRPAWFAVIVAAGIALGLRPVLPGNAYILAAAVGGSLVGSLLEGRR